MKHKYALAMIVCMIALLPAASAINLGSQSFPDVNFSDDTVNEAEKDIAVAGLSKPRIVPGSMLYPLKKLGEKLQLALAKTDGEKAKLHIKFAQERLAEASALASRNDDKRAKEVLKDFEEGIGISKKLAQKGSLNDTLDEEIAKSSLILESLLERVPEQSKGAVSHALDMVSRKKAMDGEEEQVSGKASEVAGKKAAKNKSKDPDIKENAVESGDEDKADRRSVIGKIVDGNSAAIPAQEEESDTDERMENETMEDYEDVNEANKKIGKKVKEAIEESKSIGDKITADSIKDIEDSEDEDERLI